MLYTFHTLTERIGQPRLSHYEDGSLKWFAHWHDTILKFTWNVNSRPKRVPWYFTFERLVRSLIHEIVHVSRLGNSIDNGDTWIFDEKNNLWVADHSLSGNLSVGDHPSTSKYGPRILTMSEMSVVACEDLQYYIPVLLVHVDTIPESRNMDDFMDEAADKSFKGEIPGNPFWTAIYVPREFKDGIMPMGKSF